ncbi:PhzF family phenazine biosynthesis protein [Rhodoblastus sp.]|uniref:PhzF family phenazine biosynthesis protein n=1 Tax=Rhodoblastus sp. TaxID=1962975 RepID=UPI00262F488C|nr:PhzF family phenazine biosynthesis protein [Rhodoblastus sp.]
MTRLAYHLLDVFAEKPFAGNPLAVVSDADGLTPAQMQAVAREFNLSETAFVLAPRDPVHTAALRIFTPATELPFAGHPTIGAACLIASLRAPDVIGRQPLQILVEEQAGDVVCEVSRFKNVLRGSFVPPRPPALGGILSDRAAIAAALGMGEIEIGFDAHEPATASAGLPFAFVPVRSLSALDRLAPDFSRFVAAFGRESAGVFVYARETSDPAHHVQARVFVPGLGLREDPATGSAAAAFAAVAVHFEQPEDGEHEIVIEQGFAIRRPSHIGLILRIVDGALVETRVGGACVKLGEGVLNF